MKMLDTYIHFITVNKNVKWTGSYVSLLSTQSTFLLHLRNIHKNKRQTKPKIDIIPECLLQ